jgi:hypothetical protein
MLALAGCSSGVGMRWWNPATWRSASEAHATDRAESRRDAKREEVIKAAHREVAKSTEALRSAPASREVELASRFSENADALLTQATGAITIGEWQALKKLVADLRSENEQVRAAAEQSQQASETAIAGLSAELAAAQTRLTAATSRLREAFDRENALANQLRNERLIRWGLAGAAIILAAGWLYVRFALGGLPMAAGKLMRDLRAKHSGAADIVEPIFDSYLNRYEQRAIAKYAQ